MSYVEILSHLQSANSTSWNANLPLIKNSCVNIGAIGPNNSPEETANLGSSILAIAASANVDARFILATVMQESKGCVRVQTTYGSHANPGLMQSHAGENTCGTGTNPCPASTITGMISDGVAGTPSGDGLAAILDQLSASNTKRQLSVSNSSSQAQLYYRAARTYNSGSIATTGDLGVGPGTPCYASDVANRLTGWVFADSTCTPENVVSVRTTFPITLPAGNGTSSLNTTTTTTTPSCILVQPGATCNSVAATLGVSTATFMAANPSINAACTNMFAGVTYCA